MTALEGQPPVQPARRRGALALVWAAVTSVKLALGLLVGVLLCCVAGVTLLPAARAWELIFNTAWFNGLLVVLALASGLTFFSRIWKRKLSLISVGMIVFHSCFLALLGGIAFNSLFYFQGVLRLTEGETLENDQPTNYDTSQHGRFFDWSRLHGETTLVKMHTAYQVDGKNKRAAYEVSVGEGDAKQTEVIYITHNLNHDGVRYLAAKEGYSVLVYLLDREGQPQYAGLVPLQSLKQEAGGYLYTTGTKSGPGAFPFPAPPAEPVTQLQLVYTPDPVAERRGEVMFRTWPLTAPSGEPAEGPSGKAAVGGVFDTGSFSLGVGEIRYWVGMNVRHDPGQPVILSSLVAGLAGMILTFIGRLRQDAAKRRQRPIPVGGTS